VKPARGELETIDVGDEKNNKRKTEDKDYDHS